MFQRVGRIGPKYTSSHPPPAKPANWTRSSRAWLDEKNSANGTQGGRQRNRTVFRNPNPPITPPSPIFRSESCRAPLITPSNRLDRVTRAASRQTIVRIEGCSTILQFDHVVGEETNARTVRIPARRILAGVARAADHDATPLSVLARSVDRFCGLGRRYRRAWVERGDAGRDAGDLRHPARSK